MNQRRGNAPRQGDRSNEPGREMTENAQISRDERAQERMKKPLELIRARRDEIEAVLPPDIPYSRFEAVFNMAVRRTPDLLDCYGPSVIKAVIQSAYDGLLPDGNEAVILISNNKYTRPKQGGGKEEFWRKEARYQTMVYGLRKQMVEAGAVAFVDAKVVFKNEHYVYEEGEQTIIEHRPSDPETRGEPVAVYARAKLPDGTVVYDWLWKSQVLAAKAVAKTKNVWEGPFWEEMWKKTAIRRLRKAIPTVRPIRDAEALEMFPQFAADQRGGAAALPAPPRPTRDDFRGPGQLEHHQEVPFDLGAFDNREEILVDDERASGEPARAEQRQDPPAGDQGESKPKKAAAKKAGKSDPPKPVDEKPAAEQKSSPAPKDKGPQPPATPEAWSEWVQTQIDAFNDMKTDVAINDHYRSALDYLDAAPDQLRDSLRDRLTDAQQGALIDLQPEAGAGPAQAGLDLPAGDDN